MTSNDDTEERDVLGPAVVVRVHSETGPSIMVEWRDAPTAGELIVVTRALAGIADAPRRGEQAIPAEELAWLKPARDG